MNHSSLIDKLSSLTDIYGDTSIKLPPGFEKAYLELYNLVRSSYPELFPSTGNIGNSNKDLSCQSRPKRSCDPIFNGYLGEKIPADLEKRVSEAWSYISPAD